MIFKLSLWFYLIFIIMFRLGFDISCLFYSISSNFLSSKIVFVCSSSSYSSTWIKKDSRPQQHCLHYSVASKIVTDVKKYLPRVKNKITMYYFLYFLLGTCLFYYFHFFSLIFLFFFFWNFFFSSWSFIFSFIFISHLCLKVLFSHKKWHNFPINYPFYMISFWEIIW